MDVLCIDAAYIVTRSFVVMALLLHSVSVSRQRLLAKAEHPQHVSDTPFKSPSPMKLSMGLGDYQGTFQGKIPYIAVGALWS